MGLQEIPAEWRRAVCAALKRNQVQFTHDAHKRWQRSFPGSWRYDLDQALLDVLSADHAVGCPVTMDTPPGETWEFFFQLQRRQAYGKILLRTDRKRVVIFSAHRPEKPKLRCE
ncbi:MAG: hypothetical protein ACOZE5_09355 [Verrucomicrobiota bacterium]